MEIKTCFNDATAELSCDALVIEREYGFLSVTSSRIGGGIGVKRRIINYNRVVTGSSSASTSYLSKYDRAQAVVLASEDMDKIIHLTREEVTVIITADKTFKLNYIVLIHADLDEASLLNVFKDVLESKMAAASDLGMKRPIKLIYQDELVVACRTGEDGIKDDDKQKIGIKVSDCIMEASYKLFKNMGYPRNILEHVEDAGVTIDELIEAGMELVVGVEKTEDLELKLKDQILKSLEDLNVATLIMAGIRLEEDLSLGRIQGIDVDDDPACLYSDEVLGMAVANQIAGTKAIFNFKRYDEEKPGIIGKLGPVLDDIFAGLVAGCMSKIFEE
ncbi:MAG TPA: alpha-ribazole phosphatase CobZ [Methanobacterium sp.]|nr:alpha-ribazole phosphatase CobZ [Methanobacterium sp.]